MSGSGLRLQPEERSEGLNDVWGGDPLTDGNSRFWQHNLADGLQLRRQAIETHLITSWHLAPLMVGPHRGDDRRRQRPLPRHAVL